MTTTTDRHTAGLLLRLLLDGVAPRADGALDWDLLRVVAERNEVFVRAADALERAGVHLPRRFTDAAIRARADAEGARRVMCSLARSCDTAGIEYVFPKILGHLPDIGDDLDLFVGPTTAAVDAQILGRLGATPMRRKLDERLAGRTVYGITECAVPLDIQHGRLGVFGEDTIYPSILLRNRRRVVTDGVELFAPSREDALVLEGMRRVYGRRRIPLCDVGAVIQAVRAGDLNWDYVVGTSEMLGTRPGLSCLLSYSDQVHRDVYGQPLFTGELRAALVEERWGHVQFSVDGFRFPTFRITGILYARKLAVYARSRRWMAIGRVCLLPVLGSLRLIRRGVRTLAKLQRPLLPAST